MNKIKQLRIEKHLTQLDVSRLLKVSQSAISQWENGETSPRTKTMLKLSKILGCTPNDLLQANIADS